MPNDLTIFAAHYLVYLDALLALAVVVYLLAGRPSQSILRWLVALIVAIVLGYIAAKVGAGLYNDPRPFTQDHVKPLISHAADNGFPSDHALLAAAVVAAVLLLNPYWALPFAVLASLVDWARVGAGIHHVADVLGSSVILAVATLIGYLLAPFIARLLSPYVARVGLVDRWDARRSGPPPIQGQRKAR